jgi:hypothetical protein
MNLMIRGDYLNKTPIHLDNMLYYILLYIMSYTHTHTHTHRSAPKGASVLSTTECYANSWFTPKLIFMKNCTSNKIKCLEFASSHSLSFISSCRRRKSCSNNNLCDAIWFLPTYNMERRHPIFLYRSVANLSVWKHRNLFYVRKSYSTSMRLQILP